MQLTKNPTRRSRGHPNAGKQHGVVLFVALIILIAMTLGGIALIRSVDTTNIIAGNMSFQQAAILSGERSTEHALSSVGLLAGAGADLKVAQTGYFPARADPASGTSWDAYWKSTLDAQKLSLATDASGNTVAYVIHRLCDAAGDPLTVNCAKPPSGSGGSNSSGSLNFPDDQVYYRVTTRIGGPRNTVAYIQTIVAR